MEKVILILLFYFILTPSFGQTQKKVSTDFYRQITKLDTNEIKSGKHLDVAREYTIEHFVAYYVENEKIKFTKEYGTLTIQMLYTDSIFTYFGRKYYYGLIDFFKVKVSDLENINLDNISGTEIRKNFIAKIVPESDKNKVIQKQKSCTSSNHTPQFIYDYKKETNSILITYKWRISCDFLYKIINKTYVAMYDIKTRTFSLMK
jgi:hypothetical protein